MTKKSELLEMILSTVKSDSNISPEILRCKGVYYDEQNNRNDSEMEYFTFRINKKESEYQFSIYIYRSKGWFFKTRLSSIDIEDKTRSHIDKIFFYNINKKTQRKIFNILMNREKNKSLILENKKMDKYIEEMKKSMDKSILRDEKLNEILK